MMYSLQKKLFLFSLIFLQTFLFSQNIIGNWKGELDVQSTKIPLIFHIIKTDSGLKTTFDSPMQMAKDLATKSTSFTDNKLEIDASNLGITYSAKLENNQLIGDFKQSGMTLPLVLSKMAENEQSTSLKRPQTPKPPFDYPTEEVKFINPAENNTLTGVLSLPKNQKNPPIIILINGSGQQNRDSEIYEHKSFLVLADYFAKNGFGTLRLDDRGIGGSTGANPNMTSANSVSDMKGALDFLKKKKFTKIGLLGHSEGGIIAPLLAKNNKDVKFLILLAAPGIDIPELMFLQNEKISELSGLDKSAYQTKNLILKNAFIFVKNYKGKQLKSDLISLLKKEYLAIKMPENEADKLANEVAETLTLPWFEYFLKYDAKASLKEVKQPTLAVNGSLDCQVLAKENLQGIRMALPKNSKHKILEIAGLNHLFQEAKTGNVSEYASIEQTFSPKAMDEILNWLKKL